MSPNSKAPTGRQHHSLGQRPRFITRKSAGALKGRSNGGEWFWPTPSGLNLLSMSDPGRCPGLAWHCPVGAQEGATSKAPTGRHHPSLGQRPRFLTTPPIPAPTGRANRNVRAFDPTFPNWNALRLGLISHYRLLLRVDEPAAREWHMNEAAAQNWNIPVAKAPTGGLHDSPGHRLGKSQEMKFIALKGHPKPCPSPLRASTSISFSAPRIASESFLTGFAIRSMLTWQPCCKTLDVLPCSSIPWKTTFTSSSNWPAPSLSVQPSRMLKKRLPNGSRRRGVSLPDLRGRQVMERLRSPNPMCPPSVNTSRTSRNIIGKNRFRGNTGRFWNDIGSLSMNGMFGIDATVWAAPSGLDSFSMPNPGRCPGLAWRCPVGAQDQASSTAPTGRSIFSPGQRPRSIDRPNSKAPTGRSIFSPGQRPRPIDRPNSKAPTGRHHHSLGQHTRFRATPHIPAPTGRPNRKEGAA